MNRRQLLSALGAGLLVAPLPGMAQTQGKTYRLGFLAVTSRPDSANPNPIYGAFVE